MDLLKDAIAKVSNKMLDEMEQGQSIKLNKRFELYSYYNDTDEEDWEYFVLRDYGITNDHTDWEEGFVVQYGPNDKAMFTDVYGYDNDEDFSY